MFFLKDRQTAQDNERRLKKIYYIAVKTRNFEISQLVQRNNFFMVFQGVLLASIIYSSNTVPFIQLMICITGCFVAIQQTKAAAGAKFWQEYWETEVIKAEKELETFYENKKTTPISFISIFDKKQSEIEIQVEERLNKKEPTKFESSILNLFSTKKLILEKPSVSKIPIRVGRGLTIIWIILAFSSLGGASHGLKWLTEKQIFQGFPTHKEAAKQEIYFSKDTDKSGTVIPLNIELKSLDKLSSNRPISIELSINGQKIEAKGTIK